MRGRRRESRKEETEKLAMGIGPVKWGGRNGTE